MNKLIQKLLMLLIGFSGCAFGMDISIINESDWDIEVSYKDSAGKIQTQIIDKKQTGLERAKLVIAPLELGSIDDIKELKFKGLHDKGALGWLSSFSGSPSYDGQTILNDIKKDYAEKYRYKDEYSITITIEKVRRKGNVLKWKVPFVVQHLPLKQVYNPPLIVSNVSDQEMEFSYKLEGVEKNIKIAKGSNAILGGARIITDLKGIKPTGDIQKDLAEIMADYDQEPTVVQKASDLLLEYGEDKGTLSLEDWGAVPAKKPVAISRPGKPVYFKIKPLPVLTKTGGHQIAIRNSTDQEIMVDYKTGHGAHKPKKIAPYTYLTMEEADAITRLDFHSDKHGSYDANELLNNSKKLLKEGEPQYIVFSIQSTGGIHKGTGKQHNKWVVRGHVDTYGAPESGKVPVTMKYTTMKYGGKIKQR